MKKMIKATLLLLFVAIAPVGIPDAAMALGVSVATAEQIVHAILMGASATTLIMLIMTGGGFMSFGLSYFKKRLEIYTATEVAYW